ncbi:MAG: hypothetical protein A2Z98_16570 [Spirochaetes bacterium GWB1_27_13]|nr:MAG: hypothetical protein A2Z98_16570 [Spirochaetes bacterium GWB1_27_13]
MEDKSVIIIGAGIAGLAAGYYAQTNGFKVTIFEMHDKSGGLCTCWKRKDYKIEGCVHILIGTKEGMLYNDIWNELGVIQNVNFGYSDVYYSIETLSKKVVNIYTDLDKLESHLKDISKEDSKLIEEIINFIKTIRNLNIPVEKEPSLAKLSDKIKNFINVIPFALQLQKWNSISLENLSKKFKSDVLKEAFPLLWYPEMPALFIFFMLGWLNVKNGGYPISGSEQIAKAMEKKFREVGGEIKLKSSVEKIIVEDNQAVGVKLKNGEIHKSDYVISACDGKTTFEKFLDNKFQSKFWKTFYEEQKPSSTVVKLVLGIKEKIETPEKSYLGTNIVLDPPVLIAGEKIKRMSVYINNFDKTMMPDNSTMIEVTLISDYTRWNELSKDQNLYNEEKEKVKKIVLEILEKKYPNISSKIEMLDISTPVTIQRYSHNYNGAIQGWHPNPKTMGLYLPKQLPTLKNFFMCGHWTESLGGVPIAAVTGKNIIRLICKKEKINFKNK